MLGLLGSGRLMRRGKSRSVVCGRNDANVNEAKTI